MIETVLNSGADTIWRHSNFNTQKSVPIKKNSSFPLKSACWAPDFDLWFRLHYLWDDIGDVYWSTRKNLLLYSSGRTLKKMGCGGPEPTFIVLVKPLVVSDWFELFGLWGMYLGTYSILK